MRGAGTKDGTADPHMGGAMSNCEFEVGTHTHTQSGKAIAVSNGRQHLEVRDRVLISRRNAHEAGNAKAKFIPAFGDEGVRVTRSGTGLLWLFSRIDLKKEIRVTPLRINFPRERARELWTVNRVNGIKQGDCVTHLVGLKRANEMYARMRIGLLQIRPFALRFLNTVFTKHGLPGSQHRHNSVRWKCLAYRNQRDVIGLPVSRSGGLVNLYTDGIKAGVASGGCWCAHGC